MWRIAKCKTLLASNKMLSPEDMLVGIVSCLKSPASSQLSTEGAARVVRGAQCERCRSEYHRSHRTHRRNRSNHHGNHRCLPVHCDAGTFTNPN